MIIDEGDSWIRSLVTEIDISTVMQRKDYRQSRAYATTNINSNQSFLPINNSISPKSFSDSFQPGVYAYDRGTITSFLKVSQINRRSFEEFERAQPDDFCYLVNEKVKFTDTPGNLHLEFTLFQEEKVSIARFENGFGNGVFLNLEIIPLIERVNESQSQQAGSTLLVILSGEARELPPEKAISPPSKSLKGLNGAAIGNLFKN